MTFYSISIYTGNGLDVDEYVRRAYKFAYSDCIEVGPVACLPEPPDPNELYPRESSRQVLNIFALELRYYIESAVTGSSKWHQLLFCSRLAYFFQSRDLNCCIFCLPNDLI
jgi:hypothetical protein